MYHLVHFHVSCLLGHHATICILLSTLKGKKGPFIFIKVQKIPPKYFALNVPKLKEHYNMTFSNSITWQVENSFWIKLPSQCHAYHSRTVHLSNNFLRLTLCDSMICIYLKCIRLSSIHQILCRMAFNTDISYLPHGFLFVQHHQTLHSVREPSATLKRISFFSNKNSIFSHQQTHHQLKLSLLYF